MPDENELLKVSLRSIDTRMKPIVDELAQVIQSLPAGEQRTTLTKAYNVCFPTCFWFRRVFGGPGSKPEVEEIPLKPGARKKPGNE
jgi:hypothetical protein